MYVLKIKYLLSRKKKYVPVEYRNQLESASVAQAWHNLSFDEDKRASQKVLVVKNLSANAGDLRDSSLIPGSGRSSVGGHSNSRQYSYLENPTDRAWQATVHKVAKSWTLLQWLSTRIKITVDQSPLDKFLCVIMNFIMTLGKKTIGYFLRVVRSVAQLCPTLCDPMDCSMPGFLVCHQLPEFTQTHVHRVSYAIQPSHPLSSPSPPAFNLSQHQGLFKWVSSLHQMAKILEFQLQHPSFQWIFRIGWISLQSKGLSQVFSNTAVQKHQFFGTQLSL